MNAENRILRLLEASPQHWWHGLEISNVTRTRPGRMYLVLHRLECEGFIEAQWSEGPEPRRRQYRILNEISARGL